MVEGVEAGGWDGGWRVEGGRGCRVEGGGWRGDAERVEDAWRVSLGFKSSFENALRRTKKHANRLFVL